jgi:outer membrane protein
MKHKMIFAALIGGFALSAGTVAWAADENPWLIRARAVYLDPDNKSDAIPALAVPSDAIHVSTKTIPEVDFTYFITKISPPN